MLIDLIQLSANEFHEVQRLIIQYKAIFDVFGARSDWLKSLVSEFFFI